MLFWLLLWYIHTETSCIRALTWIETYLSLLQHTHRSIHAIGQSDCSAPCALYEAAVSMNSKAVKTLRNWGVDFVEAGAVNRYALCMYVCMYVYVCMCMFIL